MRSFRDEDWDRFDEKALRWELRYLSDVRQARRRAGSFDTPAIFRRSDAKFASLCAR